MAVKPLKAPEGFVYPADVMPLGQAALLLRMKKEDSDDGANAEPAKPKISRPRKAHQPVDRSALHGPVADMPRSRSEALAEGAPFYFLGLTCTRRHNAPRTTLRKLCVVCQQEDHQKARHAAYRARKRAIKEAAAEADKEARAQARDAEREAQKKARALAKAEATREAKKAARAAAKAAALAQAAEALPGPAGPFMAPSLPPPVREVSTLDGTPWGDDSAPWDMSPATAPLAAPLIPAPLPSSPPPGPCPWDDTDALNPFE